MSADLTAFPARPDGLAWFRTELLDWEMTTVLADATDYLDLKYGERGNDVAGATIIVNKAHQSAAILDADHRVVRVSVLNLAESTPGVPVWTPAGAFIGDKPTTKAIDQGEADAETTSTPGRSIAAQLGYVRVDPSGGYGQQPVNPHRFWNFSHPSIDPWTDPNWVDAISRSLQHEQVEPPNGMLGVPWEFSNPLASWLAPLDPPAPGDPDPTGPWLIAYDDELEAETTIFIDATADNGFQLYMNERPVGVVWDPPPGNATGNAALNAWRGQVTLPAGPFRLRAVAYNFDNFPPGAWRNGGLFVCAATTPIETDGHPDEAWVFGTAGAGWRALPYAFCDPIPGPPVGAVMDDLLTEAQARGDLTWWTWDFTAATDSAGNPWDRITGPVGFTVDIGDSLLDVLDTLVDNGLVEWSVTLDAAGFPVLSMWAPLTAGDDVSTTFTAGNDEGTGNITGMVFPTDHTDALDGLVVAWSTGQTRIGAGTKTGFIRVAAADQAEAVAKATVALAKQVTSRAVQVSYTWINQAADAPPFAFKVFDRLTALDQAGTLVEARIVGIVTAIDKATGRPQYTLELDSVRTLRQRSEQATIKRLAAGMLGAASPIPATGRQRPMERLEQIQLTWSVPGTVEELVSGFVPPPVAMRVTRMLVTSTKGTGNTDFDLRQANRSVASGTIGAGEPVEEWVTLLASLVTTDQRLQLRITGDIADHENLIFIAYGSRLGLPALDRQAGT